MAGTASTWRTLGEQGFAVFAAPLAWVTQLVVGYALTGYACYPQHVWRADVAPGWDWARPASLAINLAALLIGAAGLWTAWRLWRAAPDASATAGARRRRFMGLCGLISSAAFMLGVLADTAPLLGAPTC